MPERPLAVQMYTRRDLVAADYPGTLRAVAELGYHAVELAMLGGLASSVPLVYLKALAEDHSFAEVGQDTLKFPAILETCDEAGVEWLIVEQDKCARPPRHQEYRLNNGGSPLDWSFLRLPAMV